MLCMINILPGVMRQCIYSVQPGVSDREPAASLAAGPGTSRSQEARQDTLHTHDGSDLTHSRLTHLLNLQITSSVY